LKSQVKSFINKLAQRYGCNLVLSGTCKKLLIDQQLVEAPPSLFPQVDPSFNPARLKG
jgi:hypothetical protein